MKRLLAKVEINENKLNNEDYELELFNVFTENYDTCVFTSNDNILEYDEVRDNFRPADIFEYGIVNKGSFSIATFENKNNYVLMNVDGELTRIYTFENYINAIGELEKDKIENFLIEIDGLENKEDLMEIYDYDDEDVEILLDAISDRLFDQANN